MRVWNRLERVFRRLKTLLTGVRFQRALERHHKAAAGLDAAVREVLQK